VPRIGCYLTHRSCKVGRRGRSSHERCRLPPCHQFLQCPAGSYSTSWGLTTLAGHQPATRVTQAGDAVDQKRKLFAHSPPSLPPPRCVRHLFSARLIVCAARNSLRSFAARVDRVSSATRAFCSANSRACCSPGQRRFSRYSADRSASASDPRGKSCATRPS